MFAMYDNEILSSYERERNTCITNTSSTTYTTSITYNTSIMLLPVLPLLH